MIDIFTNYRKALKDLYEHVSFTEDWVVYPIDIRINMYWKIKNGNVIFNEEKINVIEENGAHYSNEIYTQRFYDKHIYRGKEYTMIFVDTHTDGNKFFAFFSNDKEIME